MVAKKKKSKNSRKLLYTWKCGPYTWRIYSAPTGSQWLADDNGNRENHGVCDKEAQAVYIDAGLQGINFALTLKHEMVHVFLYSYPCILLHDGQEELLAEAIARAWQQIEDQNKKTKKGS